MKFVPRAFNPQPEKKAKKTTAKKKKEVKE